MERIEEGQGDKAGAKSPYWDALNPNVADAGKRLAVDVGEMHYQGLEKPGLGLYRIQEHVHRSVPRAVETIRMMRQNNERIKDAKYGVDFSLEWMQELQDVTSIQHMVQLCESALHTLRSTT